MKKRKRYQGQTNPPTSIRLSPEAKEALEFLKRCPGRVPFSLSGLCCRILQELAQQYGWSARALAPCFVCGRSDKTVDPYHDLPDLAERCPYCHRRERRGAPGIRPDLSPNPAGARFRGKPKPFDRGHEPGRGYRIRRSQTYTGKTTRDNDMPQGRVPCDARRKTDQGRCRAPAAYKRGPYMLCWQHKDVPLDQIDKVG